jgi:hypothetical protein
LIQKASIAESFEVSRQFWSYLVQENKTAPEKFHQESSSYELFGENVAKTALIHYKPIPSLRR